jgi:DNA-binding NtrC family response regulator
MKTMHGMNLRIAPSVSSITKMKSTIPTKFVDHTIPNTIVRVPTATSHILFIEDDPDLADALETTFRYADTSDFIIERAITLGSAITLLGSREIDVVLLDLNLPDSRGLETFLKIQRIAPELPVIILSGLADEALAVESVRAGAQDYVSAKGE